MAEIRKTKKKPVKRKRQSPIPSTPKSKSTPKTKSIPKSKSTSDHSLSSDNNEIHNQYYSKMTYDGNTLSVESKKNNEPVKRKKYTLKQLRREIPLAADLINKYLDGKVPSALHNNPHPPNSVSIYPVLPNPVDLGLLPPTISTMSTQPGVDVRPPSQMMREHDNGYEFGDISTDSCSQSTCQSRKRRKYDIDGLDDGIDNQMIKLFIRDIRD